MIAKNEPGLSIDEAMTEYEMWRVISKTGIDIKEGALHSKRELAELIVEPFISKPPDTEQIRRWIREAVITVDAARFLGKTDEMVQYLEHWYSFLKKTVRYYATRIMLMELYVLLSLITGDKQLYDERVRELEQYLMRVFNGDIKLPHKTRVWTWYRLALLAYIFRALTCQKVDEVKDIEQAIAKKIPMCCYHEEIFAGIVLDILLEVCDDSQRDSDSL